MPGVFVLLRPCSAGPCGALLLLLLLHLLVLLALGRPGPARCVGSGWRAPLEVFDWPSPGYPPALRCALLVCSTSSLCCGASAFRFGALSTILVYGPSSVALHPLRVSSEGTSPHSKPAQLNSQAAPARICMRSCPGCTDRCTTCAPVRLLAWLVHAASY